MQGFARTIVETDSVAATLDQYRAKYPRFDDFWIGWSWALARDPLTDAFRIPGYDPPVYLIRSHDLTNYKLPSGVTFLYRVTDDQVTILAVRAE